MSSPSFNFVCKQLNFFLKYCYSLFMHETHILEHIMILDMLGCIYIYPSQFLLYYETRTAICTCGLPERTERIQILNLLAVRAHRMSTFTYMFFFYGTYCNRILPKTHGKSQAAYSLVSYPHHQFCFDREGVRDIEVQLVGNDVRANCVHICFSSLCV